MCLTDVSSVFMVNKNSFVSRAKTPTLLVVVSLTYHELWVIVMFYMVKKIKPDGLMFNLNHALHLAVFPHS